MTSDLETNPAEAIALCHGSHTRLAETMSGLDDEQLRSPSRLPDWSVGHVLTHLARNAEGHRRRLLGALDGEEVRRYPGGTAQRDSEIEEGARRGAGEIAADVVNAQVRLEEAWRLCEQARWPNSGFLAGDSYPTTASPAHRLREVEMHHVDLGVGYEATSWPDAYVAWELEALLDTVATRLPDIAGRRALVLWLSGRRDTPPEVRLEPW